MTSPPACGASRITRPALASPFKPSSLLWTPERVLEFQIIKEVIKKKARKHGEARNLEGAGLYSGGHQNCLPFSGRFF